MYDRERTDDQRLRFNLCVYQQPPFDWHDRLTDVLDCDRLRQGILDILGAGHVNLLETLGERIVDFCLGYPQVGGVQPSDHQAVGARRLRSGLRGAASPLGTAEAGR